MLLLFKYLLKKDYIGKYCETTMDQLLKNGYEKNNLIIYASIFLVVGIIVGKNII